jgi:flagellar hook assembly protein FlgD
LDYPAFEGKDITPKGPIELEGIVETPSTDRIKLEISSPVFSYSTTISYQISDPGQVSIKLYNALGQEVRTLVEERKSSGTYTVVWDGTDNKGQDLTSGVYFCKLNSEAETAQNRMVLMK